MNEKLKPCPFCGGKAKLVETYVEKGIWVYSVDCSNCKTRQQVSKTEEEAINAWNTRVKE